MSALPWLLPLLMLALVLPAHGETAQPASPSPDVARFPGMTNVIAILSNTPPEIPPLPEPQYARPQGPRPYPANTKGADSPGQQATRSEIQNPKSKIQNPDSWHTVDVMNVRNAWAQ